MTTPTTMKAASLTKPDPNSPPTVTLTTTAPTPTPKPGHLLLRIEATAYHPSDRLNANNGFPETTHPRTPGRDFTGTVLSGPTHAPGTAVFGTGGAVLGFTLDGPHAEYASVPAGLAIPRPHHMTPLQAAWAGVPYTTAQLALTRARTTAQDSVLVIGATGSVGAAAVQIARAMGCSTVLTAARRDTADVNLLADAPFRRVKEITGGRGVDVIVNTVGDQGVMKAAFEALAARGRYSFIASGGGAGSANTLNLEVRPFYRGEFELIGCNSGHQSVEEVAASLRALTPWFESGALTPRVPRDEEVVSLEAAVGDYQTGKAPRIISFA